MTDRIRHRAYFAGYLGGDLGKIAHRLGASVRARKGHRCVVWVEADLAVMLAVEGSPDVPDFGDDAGPMVGTYLHTADEILWKSDLREALVEQAASMKVAA